MISLSPQLTPMMIKGITFHPENPLHFDFIINQGEDNLKGEAFEKEAIKLIKYFLAALTVPEQDLWVNLSPYESQRVIPPGFDQTEMGRDLLSQDYLLKQLTASLIYPEEQLGKKFWDRVYAKAMEKFGTTHIPFNTFNKIWIVPEKAVVYEHGLSAFVVESSLKVMLEEDYLALAQNAQNAQETSPKINEDNSQEINQLTSQAVREVILKEIEKEVNQGETFANLRQIYHSMILATWYKKNLEESLLGQVYADKKKIKGIELEDKEIKQKIYEQYLAAFKKGVYNYIREDYDPAKQEMIPRKYFSGGLGFEGLPTMVQSLPQGATLTPVQSTSFYRSGNFQVQGLYFENTDAAGISSARLEEKADEGPAMRWSGLPLTKEQHDIVNAAITEYFTDPEKSKLRRTLKRDEIKHLDQEGKLHGIPVYILPGLKARISEMVQQANIGSPEDKKIQDPSDLLTHVGRRKYQSLYLDEKDYEIIIQWSDPMRKAWAAHEAAHIEFPDQTEEWIQKHFPLPWKLEAELMAKPALAEPVKGVQLITSPGKGLMGDTFAALPAPIGEKGMVLPGRVNELLSVSIAKGGPEQLLSTVMRDEATVQGLLETKAWDDENALRRTLDKIAFGQPSDETVEAARKFAAIVGAGTKSRKVAYVVADTLMEKRIKAKDYMEIADEVLRKADPALAENLENLLKEDEEMQLKAFRWLFDRMLKAAEDLARGQGEGEENLLISRIIIRQFNRIMSDVDSRKWLKLRIHILMQFAKRMSEESQAEFKPLMASLIALYPNVSKDFFLAVDSNFTSVSKIYASEDPSLEHMLKDYGGYEGYAQSIETLLAFANFAWPDWFFDYLRSHYANAPDSVKAFYLASMRFGMYARTPEGEMKIIPERLDFIIANSVILARRSVVLIRKKLREIYYDLPEPFVAYLSDGEKYKVFEINHRAFLMEILLSLAIPGKIQGGRARILPFVMFELGEEEREVQKLILLGHYFDDEMLASLKEDEAKQLRSALITGYYEFQSNDIIDKNIQRIMLKFGMKSIREAFEFFTQEENIDHTKALGVLKLAGRVASQFETKEPSERLELNNIIRRVQQMAQKAVAVKLQAVKEYYELREKISQVYKEVVGMEKQIEVASTSLVAVNAQVEELKRTQDDTRAELIKLQKRLGQLPREVQIAKNNYKSAPHFSIERDKAKEAYKKKVAELTETRNAHESLKARAQEIKPEIEKAQREQTAMAVEVNAIYKLYRKKFDWLRQAEGRELYPEKEEAEEEGPEEPSGYLDQLFGQKPPEKKSEEKIPEPHVESGKETTQKSVVNAETKVEELFSIFRLFVQTPSIEPETAKNIWDSLQKVNDGDALIILLILAAHPQLAGFIPMSEVKAQFIKHLRYQAEHGLFRTEVKEELGFLTDELSLGQMLPDSKDEEVFKTVIDLLREKRYQPDQVQTMAFIATELGELRHRTEKVIKEDVIDSVVNLMGSTQAFDSMLDEFLKMKFGDEGDVVREKRQHWIRVYNYILGRQGPKVAIEFMFFMLFMTLVEPSKDKIDKPKNYAEILEQHYQIYYKAYLNFREKAFENKVKELKAEEGLGWEKEANDVALYYLASIFNSGQITPVVRQEAEKAIYLLIFLPWVNEREDKAAEAEKKKKESLSISTHAVLGNMKAYFEQAPRIDASHRNQIVGNHNANYMAELSFGLAKKVLEQLDKIPVQEQAFYMSVLEKMESVIAPDVMVEKAGRAVPVLVAIKEALGKLKKDQAGQEVLADRLLTSPVEERKLRFRLAKPERPQLPGPEDKEDEGKEDEKNKDRAMLTKSPITKPVEFKSRRADKKVTLDVSTLNELAQMTALARKNEVELQAKIYLKQGAVVGIHYPKDDTKFVIIRSKSTDELEVTEKFGYFLAPIYDLMDLKGILKAWEEAKTEGKTEIISSLENQIKEGLQYLGKNLKEFNAEMELYSVSRQERYRIDPQRLMNLQQISEAGEFLEDVVYANTAVTKWIGAKSLEAEEESIPEHDEVMTVHNHPNGNPSPPSAIISDDGMKNGDIYTRGFFNGEIMGIIMDTPQGDRLFLFHEPKADPQREEEYVKAFNLYWYQKGDLKAESAVEWKPEEQTFSLSQNFEEVMKKVENELAMESTEALFLTMKERGEAILSDGEEKDFAPENLPAVINELSLAAKSLRLERQISRPKRMTPEEFHQFVSRLPGQTVFNQAVLTDRKIQIGQTKVYGGFLFDQRQGVFSVESADSDTKIEEAIRAAFELGQRDPRHPLPTPYFHFSFLMRSNMDGKPYTSFQRKDGSVISKEGYHFVTIGFRGPIVILVIDDEFHRYLGENGFDNFVGATRDQVAWAILSELQVVANYKELKDWFEWTGAEGEGKDKDKGKDEAMLTFSDTTVDDIVRTLHEAGIGKEEVDEADVIAASGQSRNLSEFFQNLAFGASVSAIEVETALEGRVIFKSRDGEEILDDEQASTDRLRQTKDQAILTATGADMAPQDKVPLVLSLASSIASMRKGGLSSPKVRESVLANYREMLKEFDELTAATLSLGLAMQYSQGQLRRDWLLKRFEEIAAHGVVNSQEAVAILNLAGIMEDLKASLPKNEIPGKIVERYQRIFDQIFSQDAAAILVLAVTAGLVAIPSIPEEKRMEEVVDRYQRMRDEAETHSEATSALLTLEATLEILKNKSKTAEAMELMVLRRFKKRSPPPYEAEKDVLLSLGGVMEAWGSNAEYEQARRLIERNSKELAGKISESPGGRDEAILSGTSKPPGGIDLNPAYLDLQIRRDENGVPLPLPQQPLNTMHIEGFFPVIMNITPVNLPFLLGIAGQSEEQKDLTYHPPVDKQVAIIKR